MCPDKHADLKADPNYHWVVCVTTLSNPGRFHVIICIMHTPL